MSQLAQVISFTEFQVRRAVREIQNRKAPRRFLWNVPALGVTLTLSPDAGGRSERSDSLARTGG